MLQARALGQGFRRLMEGDIDTQVDGVYGVQQLIGTAQRIS